MGGTAVASSKGMTKTWILVAHKSGARIIESPVYGGALNVVREIDHPEGRLQNSEIDADRGGRVFESAAPAQRGMTREQSATERVAANFARDVASELERGRLDHRFDQLVLVAPPRFLGRMRTAMSDETGKLVSASVSKDLPDVSPEKIREHLSDVILF